MLRRLGIRNYALIESVDLEFSPGFTVITGETGSGKSIMLGALSLLTGSRADSRVAMGRKSRVEAIFEDVDALMKDILVAKGIDWIESTDREGIIHNEITIRREIAAEGRSRVYVNDTPVTLATLCEIGPKLIYIHSQHSNADIADNASQLRIVDVFADDAEQLKAYNEAFGNFLSLKKRIDSIKETISRNKENEKFLRFQCAQLDKLKPRAGELAEIEKRYEMLSDADDIKERLNTLSAILNDPESGALTGISEAKSIIDRIDMKLFGSETGMGIPERLHGIQAELEDIADTIDDLNSTVDTDPATLQALSARMTAYYDAVKHFRVSNADELESLHKSLRRQIAEISYGGEDLRVLESAAREQAKSLRYHADILSEARAASARTLADSILDTAGRLGLPNLKFEIQLSRGKMSQSGQDHVEFVCSFNRQGDLRPVGDTASGGEISRLMLSIKAVMARRMSMPTIVFDEVDTGVSGEIAELMGRMMRSMGGQMQVMSITHLPQVAAQGVSHFKVYKQDENDRTVTYVSELTGIDRIREIASMISGSEVTDAAIQNARALIKRAN